MCFRIVNEFNYYDRNMLIKLNYREIIDVYCLHFIWILSELLLVSTRSEGDLILMSLFLVFRKSSSSYVSSLFVYYEG